MMDYKDYYAALGVASDSNEQDIKQAYRKLAREYHPDVNPGDTGAEERFKDINEAYQALSDTDRRQQYDALREQYQHWQQQGGRGDFNGGDVYASRRGTSTARPYTSPAYPEDMEDLFGSASPFSNFFSTMYGQQAAGSAERPGEARLRRGRDAEISADITLVEAFHGTNRTLQINDRRIEARIPPGVRTGSRVRLTGQGGPGSGGGPAGDLDLIVKVTPHPAFERDGDDLRANSSVDFYTAVLGGDVRVAAIDGSVKLKLPPHTQADRTFRLRGKGMPRLGGAGERGDMFVRVKLVLPELIENTELDGLRQLAKAHGRTPEAHLNTETVV